jgi:hypothetical protein
MAINIMHETEEVQGLQEAEAEPTEPVFTAEQRRMLGQVCQMILGWRRERLIRTELSIADHDPATTGAALAAEVEA